MSPDDFVKSALDDLRPAEIGPAVEKALMRFLMQQGFSQCEVAQRLGITRGTLRKRLVGYGLYQPKLDLRSPLYRPMLYGGGERHG